MNNNKSKISCKRGFTLIELLVVVLIIGILAAVAVPQYQVAVTKAKLTRYMALVDALYKAQQVYFFANGEYAQTIENLDMDLPVNTTCEHSQSLGTRYQDIYTCHGVSVGIIDGNNVGANISSTLSYRKNLVERESPYGTGNIYTTGMGFCMAKPSDKIAQRVCQGMGGTYLEETQNWIFYKMS